MRRAKRWTGAVPREVKKAAEAQVDLERRREAYERRREAYERQLATTELRRAGGVRSAGESFSWVTTKES